MSHPLVLARSSEPLHQPIHEPHHADVVTLGILGRLNLDAAMFTKCLASAPSRSAPGPGGCTYEMLKLCLDDAETSHLLFRAAEDLARAQACITRAFMCDDDSLAETGWWCAWDRHWHVVPQAGCEDVGPSIREGCGGSLCSVSVRPLHKGGHRLRRTRDQGVQRRRSSVYSALHRRRGGHMTTCCGAASFRSCTACPACRGCYLSQDPCTLAPRRMCGKMAPGSGTRFIKQRGANKETLSCLCFSVWAFTIPFAQWTRGSDQMTSCSRSWMTCTLSPFHTGRDILEEQLWTGAGIQLHTGKTRVWNREGTCPVGVEELGDEVWSPSGIKILGTPIGSPEFVRTIIAKRKADCGTQSLGCQICSARSRSSCSVLDPGATICCALNWNLADLLLWSSVLQLSQCLQSLRGQRGLAFLIRRHLPSGSPELLTNLIGGPLPSTQPTDLWQTY